MLTTLDHFSPGLDLCPIPFPPRSLPGPLPSPQVAEYSPLFLSGCGDVSQANVEWHVRFVSKVKIRLRKSGTPGCLGNVQIGCGSFEKCWGLSAFCVWQRRVWLKFKAGQDFKALADFELDLSGKKGALELEAFGYEVTGLKCNVYKIFIFQINSVLFYLIKKKLSPIQYITMISEGSRDTEDWSNGCWQLHCGKCSDCFCYFLVFWWLGNEDVVWLCWGEDWRWAHFLLHQPGCQQEECPDHVWRWEQIQMRNQKTLKSRLSA